MVRPIAGRHIAQVIRVLEFAETGLFLALALALSWYCFWRLNRRRLA